MILLKNYSLYVKTPTMVCRDYECVLVISSYQNKKSRLGKMSEPTGVL